MSKYVEEKFMYISNNLSSKKNITDSKLTQKHNTRGWSEVYKKKVIYKISAQYIKACRRKVQKTV